MTHKALCIIGLSICCGHLHAQNDSLLLGRLLKTPLHYIASKTQTAPDIDGNLTDPAWQTAAWTEYFSDIEGDIRPKPLYQTRVKMLWDDQYLYIGAELEEPNVWAYVTGHDEVVFRDNDFEVFVNPDNNARNYFEIETNAIKTIFDLFLPEPYKNGGDPLVGWDAQGLKKAVHINGTLNDPRDKDHGWTVEMAIPIWSISMGNQPETPHPGSLWRINFSRVEWDTDAKDGKYVKRTDPATQKTLPEHNWVWSPQGVIDMHFPERWGYLLFADTIARTPSRATAFTLPLSEKMKNRLWELYYRQSFYFRDHGTYAENLSALNIDSVTNMDGHGTLMKMEATPHTYAAILVCADTGEAFIIDSKGIINRAR